MSISMSKHNSRHDGILNRTETQMLFLAATRQEHGVAATEALDEAEASALRALVSFGYLAVRVTGGYEVTALGADAARSYGF